MGPLELNNGGRLLPHLSRWTANGQYALIFFHSRLAIFSLISKLQINSYHIAEASSFVDCKLSETDPDVAYVLDNKNHLHIINWRSTNASPIVKSVDLASIYASPHKKHSSFVKILNLVNDNKFNFLVKSAAKKSTDLSCSSSSSSYSLVSIDLSTSAHVTLASWNNISHFSVSSNEQNLLFVDTSDHKLFICSIDDSYENLFDNYSTDYIHKTPITSCAISSNFENPLVALASSSGIIQLLFINLSNKSSSQRLLKWHINQPLSLRFTPDDEYLISGGSEKVLVFWNVVNEKQQFLPRINGSIVNITLNAKCPSFYGLTLSLIDGESQFIILGSTDLISKFDVSSPRLLNGANDFASQLLEKKNGFNPFELTNVNNGQVFKNIQKDLKVHSKNPKELNNKFKYSQSCLQSYFKINPINDNLYIPTGSYVQIYNLMRPSDSSIISVAPLVQQYGKVGNEQKIRDPVVKFLQFTKNGQWMITLDVEYRGEIEENVGQPEEIETLRFWKLINNEFTLQTKIIVNHTQQFNNNGSDNTNGSQSSKITCILTGPLDYFNGDSLVTLDSKGEIKLWRPNSNNVWTLRKFYSFGNDIPLNSTPLCSWSNDDSLISIVMGSKINLLDINTFQPITLDLNLELQDNHPKFIKFLNDGKYLLLNTKTHAIIYDILKGETKWGLIIGNGNSIVNATNDEIAIIGRYINSNNEINTKLTIWKINQNDGEINCVSCENYNGILNGIEYNFNWKSWVVVDINSKIGLVKSNSSSLAWSDEDSLANNEIDVSINEYQLSNMLNNARIINQNKKSNAIDSNDKLGLKNGVFDLMLTDLEGLSVDILFDRIVKVL